MAVSFSQLVERIQSSSLLPKDEIEKLKANAHKTIEPDKFLKMLVSSKRLTAWQATQLVYQDHPLKIGKYIIKRLLQNYDTGTLYAAEKETRKESCSLFVLQESAVSDRALLKRIQESSESLAELKSNSLIHPTKIRKLDGKIAFVLNSVEGHSLAEYVQQKGALGKHETVNIAQKLITSLDELHEKGFSKFGLSPNSVFIDDKGKTSILFLNPNLLNDSTEDAIDKSFTHDSDASEIACDVASLGKLGLFMLAGDSNFDTESKSPINTLFARMFSGSPRIEDTARTNKLLNRWMEANPPSEEPDFDMVVQPIETEIEDSTLIPPDAALAVSENESEVIDENLVVEAAIDSGEIPVVNTVEGKPASPGLNLGINTGDSRRHAKPKSRTNQTAASSANPTPSSNQTTQNTPSQLGDEPKSNKKLIIGIVAGIAGLFLFASVSGTLLYLFVFKGNNPPAVAQTITGNVTKEDTSEGIAPPPPNSANTTKDAANPANPDKKTDGKSNDKSPDQSTPTIPLAKSPLTKSPQITC